MTPGRRHLGHAELYVRVSTVVSPENRSRIRELVDLFVVEGKRGMGQGTRLLNKVCREADLQRMALMVHVKPFDRIDPDAAVDTQRLSGWYAKHGFQPIQQEPEIVMVRMPRQ
jgi:GNAT superfamily N-acetyltransferase